MTAATVLVGLCVLYWGAGKALLRLGIYGGARRLSEMGIMIEGEGAHPVILEALHSPNRTVCRTAIDNTCTMIKRKIGPPLPFIERLCEIAENDPNVYLREDTAAWLVGLAYEGTEADLLFRTGLANLDDSSERVRVSSSTLLLGIDPTNERTEKVLARLKEIEPAEPPLLDPAYVEQLKHVHRDVSAK